MYNMNDFKSFISSLSIIERYFEGTCVVGKNEFNKPTMDSVEISVTGGIISLLYDNETSNIIYTDTDTQYRAVNIFFRHNNSIRVFTDNLRVGQNIYSFPLDKDVLFNAMVMDKFFPTPDLLLHIHKAHSLILKYNFKYSFLNMDL